MPLTPFHLGPILLLFSLVLSSDLLALFLGGTLMDIEGLAYYAFNAYPTPHGVLHSILGATLVGMVGAVLAYELRSAFDEKWKKIADFETLILSGLFGAYMHIGLDAFMHEDLNLLWPMKYWNPLLNQVPDLTLHEFCVAAFILGLFILGIRKLVFGGKDG